MKVIKKIVPVILALAVSVLLIIFRTMPTGKLWNDYSVLYTDKNVSDSLVMQAFDSFGVQGFVCESNQDVPYVFTNEFLDRMTIQINEDFEDFKYLKDRQKYFYDKTQSYRLYYAPARYKKNLADCASYLETATGLKAGIDSSSSYMRLLVIIFAVFVVILTVTSKNKALFVAGSIIPAIYSFCFPFYSSMIAACMLVLCVFFFCNLWKRAGAFKIMYKRFFIPAILLFSFVLSFSATLSAGFFYLLTVLGSASVILIYFYLEELYLSTLSFHPVMIRPAKMISPYGGKKKLVLLSALCATGVVIIFFFVTSAGNFSLNSSSLQLPAESAQRDESLPQLEDYYLWNWNVKTYPYRSLNQNNSDDGVATYPRYVLSDGKIENSQDVMVYNDSYKRKVFDQIDQLEFNSIEKVIKSQDADFVPGYKSSGSYQVNIFSIICMFICFAMLLFIYISAIIRKGGKK
ncbi:MAG: hypothetical protein K6A43_03720 [Treponema sp.]|nr:hypothetical protein [Treponema sp.]